MRSAFLALLAAAAAALGPHEVAVITPLNVTAVAAQGDDGSLTPLQRADTFAPLWRGRLPASAAHFRYVADGGAPEEPIREGAGATVDVLGQRRADVSGPAPALPALHEPRIAVAPHPAFDDGGVSSVFVWMPDLALLEHDKSKEYVPCNVSFVGHDGFAFEMADAGVRLSGGTSPYLFFKKSLKFKFDEFVPKARFAGLKHLKLRGNCLDDALGMREKISLDVRAAMGVPMYRGAFARVFLNDEFYGLFLTNEVMDAPFYRAHYGGVGNVFDHGEFYNLGPEPPATAYALKRHGKGQPDDHSDLQALIDALNFGSAPAEAFAVEDFARNVAVDVVTGSWDNYWVGSNNYELLHDPTDGRFRFVTQDFDNSFGSPFSDRWWTFLHEQGNQPVPFFNLTLDVVLYLPLDPEKFPQPVHLQDLGHNHWAIERSPKGPLISRVLAVSPFRERYFAHARDLVHGLFSADEAGPLARRMRHMHAMIAPDAEREADLGYGYTSRAAFADALDNRASNTQVSLIGMLEWVRERRMNLEAQLFYATVLRLDDSSVVVATVAPLAALVVLGVVMAVPVAYGQASRRRGYSEVSV